MTGREFLQRVTNGRGDFLQAFLDLLAAQRARFCVIGGLAVNAYAEPVVSLDLDVIIVAEQFAKLLPVLKARYATEEFPHSVNISDASSDLRVQIQTDPRYQSFIERATIRAVLGYRLPVAAIEDVFQGKVWAAMDPGRRPSKRQKDLADMLRLIEAHPSLRDRLPESLKTQLFDAP